MTYVEYNNNLPDSSEDLEIKDGQSTHGQHAGEGQGAKNLYSERLKTNVRYDQRFKRNVLEIALEKTSNEIDNIDVSDEDLARVFKTLGIDIVTQVQGTQIHYKGKYSIISVWMAAGVNLDKYCKDISIKVAPGVMTGMIRPAGKKDVTASIDGLDFNTPDGFVIDYLNKFGIVLSNTVLYTKHETGPLKGKFNGGRKFQVDFSKSNGQMGTFHIIDGSKVRIFYRGNKKTCGRCHKVATLCPGEAVAKNCAAGGGERIFLSDHMKQLWQQVGFVPVTFELDDDDKTNDDVQQAAKDVSVIETVKLPPAKVRQEPSKRDIGHYEGITVRNFPADLEEKEIITFLMNYGMPHDLSHEHVNITKGAKNTMVVVDGLSSENVLTIFNSIHFHETKQKFFEKSVPLYCKSIRKMTPKKPEAAKIDENKAASTADPKPIDAMTNANALENVEENVKENKEPTKPSIPGLPEHERLKKPKIKRKKKKNQNEDENEDSRQLTRTDFLISPESGVLKDQNNPDNNFIFSDYDSNAAGDEESESDDEDNNAFEDSKETLSDTENTENTPSASTSDLFTPVQLKSTFARTLEAKSKSEAKPTSTPKVQSVLKSTPKIQAASLKPSNKPNKREANSPLDVKDQKKQRSQSQLSQIPKKK